MSATRCKWDNDVRVLLKASDTGWAIRVCRRCDTAAPTGAADGDPTVPRFGPPNLPPAPAPPRA